MFARSDAEAATNGAKNGAVSREVADRIIAQVVKALDRRLPRISFKVVETLNGLPSHIRGNADTQKVREARRVDHEVTGYAVLSSYQAANEVEETVFHALYGHAGLSELYNNSITDNLDDLYTLVEDVKGWRSAALPYFVASRLARRI